MGKKCCHLKWEKFAIWVPYSNQCLFLNISQLENEDYGRESIWQIGLPVAIFFQLCKWEFFAKSNFDRIEQSGSPSFMMMNQEQDFTITSVTALQLTTFLHMYFIVWSTYCTLVTNSIHVDYILGS